MTACPLTAVGVRRARVSPRPSVFVRQLIDSRFVQGAAGLSLIIVVMAWIEFSGPAILDNDGYYHIRWAAMLKQSAPRLPKFSQLPLTTLNERDYVDHHYLFHVLLIPFTSGDMRVGAKLAAAIFSSAAIASLFALLVVYRVPYKWLWLAPLVLSSQPFLYRMSMTRAPALSIVLLGIGSYLILERKLRWLALLSFVFVWTYSLFPLIVVFAAAHAITRLPCRAAGRLERARGDCFRRGRGAGRQPLLPKKPRTLLGAPGDEGHGGVFRERGGGMVSVRDVGHARKQRAGLRDLLCGAGRVRFPRPRARRRSRSFSSSSRSSFY